MLSFHTECSKLRLPLSHHSHFVAKVMNQRKIIKTKQIEKMRVNKTSETLSAKKKEKSFECICVEVSSSREVNTSGRLLIRKTKTISFWFSSRVSLLEERRALLIFNFSQRCHNKSQPPPPVCRRRRLLCRLLTAASLAPLCARGVKKGG